MYCKKIENYVSILLFNKNLIEQVIVLSLLPPSRNMNKLPISAENPFLCTVELTGVEETAKGSVGAEMK